MSTQLLEEFLAQDCDAASRAQILAEIAQHGAGSAKVLREFTFNRFNLRLDFGKQEAAIEDELGMLEKSSVVLALNVFSAALQRHQPRA